MARLPLPAYVELPVGVYFHMEHPSSKEFVLQVPNADRTSSETYVVDLNNPDDKRWFEGLKRSDAVFYMLKYAMHVAYKPSNGHCEEIKDLDAPSKAERLVKAAHAAHTMDSVLDRASTFRNRLSMTTPPFAASLAQARRWR